VGHCCIALGIFKRKEVQVKNVEAWLKQQVGTKRRVMMSNDARIHKVWGKNSFKDWES